MVNNVITINKTNNHLSHNKIYVYSWIHLSGETGILFFILTWPIIG